MFLRLSRPHHHDTINILTVCYFKSIMENKNHQQETFKSSYQSLVNSARILFVEKGYQAVSIDEISGKALVTNLLLTGPASGFSSFSSFSSSAFNFL